MCECDLLITLGARFSDRVTGDTKTFAPKAKIVHLDIDASSISRNVVVDVPVVSDAKIALERLVEWAEAKNTDKWLAKIGMWQEENPLEMRRDHGLSPQMIMEAINDTFPQGIVVTDVGQHQMWAAQYYKYTEPRTLLTSGGLGTMGYGLGAALGAKSGREDKVVVNIAGDGCFRMNMNEIATAVRHNIPVIQVVINNHVLGMVRQWQNLFYGQRYSATVLNDAVDFVKLAEAMGAEGIRATTQEEFKSAFEKAMNLGRPVVIDCQIDSDDKVWPMVAPGAAISEAFDEADLKNK